VLEHEGDFSMASRCSVLGQFDLEGIPPAAEGVPRIQTTFMISKDGLLDVPRDGPRAKPTILFDSGVRE
jgi:molecular chaperone DnaK (HSP70)